MKEKIDIVLLVVTSSANFSMKFSRNGKIAKSFEDVLAFGKYKNYEELAKDMLKRFNDVAEMILCEVYPNNELDNMIVLFEYGKINILDFPKPLN